MRLTEEQMAIKLSILFHSLYPENNLVRAREWMRIHRKELEIIRTAADIGIEQAVIAERKAIAFWGERFCTSHAADHDYSVWRFYCPGCIAALRRGERPKE